MTNPLTRILALALRHKPELFGVTLDRSGWTSLEALLEGLEKRFPALLASETSIKVLLAEHTVKRFEISAGRIRALYGHSQSHVLVGTFAVPPALLFHATRTDLLHQIRTTGLTARGRRGVHLTSSWKYALSVRDAHEHGKHRGVILEIDTTTTRFKGIPFYQASDIIWVLPYIPPAYLALCQIARSNERVSSLRFGQEQASFGSLLQSKLLNALPEDP